VIAACLRPFSAPGSALEPWVLLDSTEQGTAPFDPAGYAGVGTAFDPGTGLFTIVEAGDTTQRQGYRSSLLRWTARVVDLYPDFDPILDALDIALSDIVVPKTGTSGYGISCCLLDEPTGGVASANGAGFGYRENTLTNYLSAKQGATGPSSTAQFSGAILGLVARFYWNPVGTDINYSGWKRDSGGWDSLLTSTTPNTIDADPANLRLHLTDLHSTTTSNTPTMQFKVWHRRVRTTGIAGLPT
jgi:hypothetical protein